MDQDQQSVWTNTLLRGHASPSVRWVMMLELKRAILAPYGGGSLPPQLTDYANKADGLIPCFAGTRAHPYGGGSLPSQFTDYANNADGLTPIRTVGVHSHRQSSDV